MFENPPKKSPEHPKQETLKQTKDGFWLKQIMKKEKGRLVYERKKLFIDRIHPQEGKEKYDYEKHFKYDEEGRLIREQGQDFLKKNEWRKDFEWEKGKMVSETGEILSGHDKGHKWHKSFKRDEQGNVILEEGETLEQGINPNKSPKGHKWRKRHFYKNGKWVGEIGEIIAGPKKGKVWTKGEVPKEELKNL